MAETYTAFFNPSIDFSTREDIGLEIIRYIQDRSKNGRGIGNRPFSGPNGNNKYSDNYRRSAPFSNAGKTGETVVNLTLTGDTLDSIEILDASIAGRIVIGYNEGFENDKARYMKEKGYEFLGLTAPELNSIVSRFDNNQGETSGSILRRFLGDDES